MKPQRFVALTVVLFVLCLSAASALDVEYNEGYALSKTVERSDLIVVGRVTEIEFIWRDNIESKHTTDITVTVDQLIKGAPNIDANKVRFMIEGGDCVNPHTGERTVKYVSHVPEFTVGEEILLFMVKSKDPYYANYPYDKLYPYRGDYGKSLIVDDKIMMFYLLSETDAKAVKPVTMSLDLAVNLCKAAIKDKDEIVELEADIKTEMKQQSDFMVNLSDALTKRLKREAKQIIGKNSQLCGSTTTRPSMTIMERGREKCVSNR